MTHREIEKKKEKGGGEKVRENETGENNLGSQRPKEEFVIFFKNVPFLLSTIFFQVQLHNNTADRYTILVLNKICKIKWIMEDFHCSVAFNTLTNEWTIKEWKGLIRNYEVLKKSYRQANIDGKKLKIQHNELQIIIKDNNIDLK